MTEMLTVLDQDSRLIADPITGELIDPTDADAMAEAYDRMEALAGDLAGAMKAIRVAFGDLASEGDAKTRRVRGAKHRVKVEMPSPTWNQAALRQAWREWPQIAPEFIRIDRFGVRLREVAKIKNEAGGTDFAAFRRLLLGAEEAPTAPPRIVIETSSEREQSEQEWRLTGALVRSLKGGA